MACCHLWGRRESDSTERLNNNHGSTISAHVTTTGSMQEHCPLYVGYLKTSTSVQLLSHVQLFATPRTTACQASVSITNSRSLPKLMSIEWMMPSKHLILFRPLLLLLSIFPSIQKHFFSLKLKYSLQKSSQSENCSVVSDSLQPYILQARVGSLSRLQGNLPNTEIEPGSPAL